MVTVDVDGSCQLLAYSQPKSVGSVWGLATTWRSVWIHQMNRVNSCNGSEPWWQHHKYHWSLLLLILNKKPFWFRSHKGYFVCCILECFLLKTFGIWRSFCKLCIIILLTGSLQVCCDLGQLWYREFYLEMTKGERIQVSLSICS